KRSCSTKKLERDDDSRKGHPALVERRDACIDAPSHAAVLDDERAALARLAVQRRQHHVLGGTRDGKTIDRDELVADLHACDRRIVGGSRSGLANDPADEIAVLPPHQREPYLVEIMRGGRGLLPPISRAAWIVDGELEILQDIAAEPADDRPARALLPVVPKEVADQTIEERPENRAGSENADILQATGAEASLRHACDHAGLFEGVIDHVGIALAHRPLGAPPFGMRAEPLRHDIAAHPAVAGAGVDD